MVGMSKSGSRYGRRSNWFKIHCLLQEQQQAQQNINPGGNSHNHQTVKQPQRTPPPHHPGLNLGMLNHQFPPPMLHLPKTKEELMLLGLDDYHKHATSPSVSSPESHNSDSSVEVGDARRMPIFPGFLPPSFLPPPNLLFPPGYPPIYPGLLQPVNFNANNNNTTTNNNNNRMMRNYNPGVEVFSKRIFLDAVLQSQRTPTPEGRERQGSTTPEAPPSADSPIQDDPIDLSMKTSERGSSPANSEHSTPSESNFERGSEADEESGCESERELKRIKLVRPTPLDLTTKV